MGRREGGEAERRREMKGMIIRKPNLVAQHAKQTNIKPHTHTHTRIASRSVRVVNSPIAAPIQCHRRCEEPPKPTIRLIPVRPPASVAPTMPAMPAAPTVPTAPAAADHGAERRRQLPPPSLESGHEAMEPVGAHTAPHVIRRHDGVDYIHTTPQRKRRAT